MDEPTTPAPAIPPTPTQPSRFTPWVWVGLIASLGVLIASMAWPVVAFLMFMEHQKSEAEFFDEGTHGPGMSATYYVEQESVLEAVVEPCEAMIEAAENVALGGPTDETAASLHDWTTVAQEIVTAIDGAEPNQDSREWRDDWKSTIKAVNTFADKLGQPKNTLTLPDVQSMYYETDADCGVPVVIAGLDPAWAGYMLGE